MKKHIPNFITCLNLFSGCIGILYALQGDFVVAFYCILASGIFDFFDGMVARLLHVKSLIGKELDSLADVVSFGYLPGVVMYMLLSAHTTIPYLPYMGFVITIFSALRLAKFNIDERQTNDFIGLNTPMNTFFIISIPFIIESYPSLAQDWLLLAVIVGVSYLLVSEIKLFSMKLSSLGWSVNRYKYIFLLISVALVVSLGFLGIPLLLMAYIIFSYLHFSAEKKLL